MILLIVATILSFASIHSILLGKQILKWWNKPTTKEKDLMTQKNDLKKVQKSISITDNFAKYSRIQRQINKIDEDLNTYKVGKNNLFIHFGLTYGLKVFFGLLLVGLSIYYRSTPVMKIPSDIDLTPFDRFISYPHSEKVVSFHFWVLCSSATAKLIKY
ncbi:unnamed protein product [Phyllotreta striolata]|uniref:Guided entry of tail-anchored proteins factor 1 n=1 Tax=Phyllotreta striolata TaxID=444603 RepID=A0A9N9TSM2_PHYSR|nr:unnamed protein product [Phyllotreta striolata]